MCVHASTFLLCVGVPWPPCCFFSSSSCAVREVTLALFCRRSFDNLDSHVSFSTWVKDNMLFISSLTYDKLHALCRSNSYNIWKGAAKNVDLDSVRWMVVWWWPVMEWMSLFHSPVRWLLRQAFTVSWLNSNLTVLSLVLCSRLWLGSLIVN